MRQPLGTSVRALPGGDMLRWDCGSFLVLLALATFVWRRLGGNDPLSSHRNNLSAAPSSAVVHGCLCFQLTSSRWWQI